MKMSDKRILTMEVKVQNQVSIVVIGFPVSTFGEVKCLFMHLKNNYILSNIYKKYKELIIRLS